MGWGKPHPLKKKIMKFKKKILRESLAIKENGVNTFSEKSQSIVMSESQLERLIENIQNKK